MDTAFDYLKEVHGDLLAVAVRERAGRRRRPPGGRLARFVAAAAAFIAVAGIVGAILRSGGSFTSDDAGGGGAVEAAATGPTGEVAGPMPTPAELREFGFVGDQDAGREGLVAAETAPGPAIDARIIRTAELELKIPRDSFDDRFADVTDVAEDNGGFVANSTARERSGSVTIRVPADRFADALRELRELGEVEVQSVRGQDVTAEYVDLQGRLRIARARRVVLLDLMGEATTIEQTIRVQNALDDTQLRIEGLQGQLRLLDDRTSLATIRLSMREEGTQPEPEIEGASFSEAFERSVAGFTDVIAAIVIGAGYLLPLVAIALIVWLLVVLIRRRRAA
jgi:hypothetical protein